MGGVIKGIGRVASKVAPVAGIINPALGVALGAGGSLVGGQNVARGALGGAAGGLGGMALRGPLHGIAGKIGRVLSRPDVLGREGGGGIDIGKVIGAGSGIMDFIGAQKQRKSAQRYTDAQTDQRNQLMSKILAPSNYGFTPNLNEQSSATRAQ